MATRLSVVLAILAIMMRPAHVGKAQICHSEYPFNKSNFRL